MLVVNIAKIAVPADEVKCPPSALTPSCGAFRNKYTQYVLPDPLNRITIVMHIWYNQGASRPPGAGRKYEKWQEQ